MYGVARSFWKKKFLLNHEPDLQRILHSNVTELWIDTNRGDDISPGHPSKTVEEVEEVEVEIDARLLTVENKVRPPQVTMKEEISRARRLCAHTKVAVVEMFSDLRMGRAVKLEHVTALVEEISQSLLRHPHALISLARLKTSDDYTYMHSIAVGGLMIALARQLGLTEDLVCEAGMAGLLHDVGKMAIPDTILNKAGTLTDAEFSIMCVIAWT